MEQLTNTPSFDQPELNVINVGDTQEFELWVLRPIGSAVACYRKAAMTYVWGRR